MSTHVKVRGRILALGGCAVLEDILSAFVAPADDGPLAQRPSEAPPGVVSALGTRVSCNAERPALRVLG